MIINDNINKCISIIRNIDDTNMKIEEINKSNDKFAEPGVYIYLEERNQIFAKWEDVAKKFSEYLAKNNI